MNAATATASAEAVRRPAVVIRNTPDLKVGDTLQIHGSRFLLTSFMRDADTSIAQALLIEKHGKTMRISDDEFRKHVDSERNTRAFATQYLGATPCDDVESHEAIPACWRRDWTVQGNHLAFWRVEVEGGAA